jgi:hypothetical protein
MVVAGSVPRVEPRLEPQLQVRLLAYFDHNKGKY